LPKFPSLGKNDKYKANPLNEIEPFFVCESQMDRDLLNFMFLSVMEDKRENL
jgi:hypothetical protein